MRDCNGIGVSVHSALLDDTQKKTFQQAIRCLLYLMHYTRPDLAYSVIRLAQYSSKPEKHHWDAIKRIFRYLQATRQATLNLGNLSKEILHGYFDSAHSDNHDKRSTSSYVFLLYSSLIS